MADAGLQRRHDFVLYFDVTNGNPNGDPDAGNMPRMDPETGHGLVSDVCLKRKVRNYVEMAAEADGRDPIRNRIYVTEGAVLNEKHREAYLALRPDDPKARTDKKLTPKSDEEAVLIRRFMCDNFFDIRTFGAVLSTGINAGQVRGPVQVSFARSVEPVLPLEVSITRMAATNEAERNERQDGEDKAGKRGDKRTMGRKHMAATNEAERNERQDGDDEAEKRGDKRTMGRKHIVPYGLYRAHGYVSAPLASHPVKGTGFSDGDLALLFEALRNMFEHDRSATRGEMATRRLVVFRHASALGNAPAQSLFERVRTLRAHKGSVHEIGAPGTDNWPPARSFADYAITVDREGLPQGIEVTEW
ncbi:CRISPR-associated protein, Csd2 family [Methylobacterium sp. 4-46]|uniref:type I-C CRISPR-associated protein Cas7/Csd2 n=1 Tax=unclassified Methylobacterium TaxID=2615210 RepID=UPI000152E61F|nr:MULTISPECIES: type I-C CRISPR-associated protein Cas7/Csd2 [Methylobacterium]ACA16218.1 CRISPR-associated protein, Csd2 family [Methylobacterium sp. 4-46]WFT81925.1 type I-C CRISPR-associated protein Cas7/Csd2 [Methylobacterium nodulans]